MNDGRHPVVLLTGASSGIGLEIARLLTARGCEVWGASRDVARLPALPRFHPVRMDLSRDESIREGFAQALRESGGFDVLINNAGAAIFGLTAAIPAELTREQFQILVHGPLELIQLALPTLRQRPRATVINISSLAGMFPVPFMAAYSAAKAALSAFSGGLRMELAGTAVRVVDVRPGDINTPFHDSTRRVSGESEDRARLERAWELQQREMAAGPPPQRVAGAVWRVIESDNPPAVVIVGNFFQARLAVWAARLLPARLLGWALRRYFKL